MRNRFARRIAAMTAALLVSGGALCASPKSSGIYWNPAESGWGIAVDQQGDTVFAVLLHYGPGGQPTWYVMPDMAKDKFNPFVGSRTIHEGAVYQATATRTPAESKSIYASSVVVESRGAAGINFETAGDSAFWYQIGGYNGYKTVRPLAFSQSVPVCEEDDGALAESKNYQGMWWNAPAGSEVGWALYLAHQGDVVFAVSLGYDEQGSATWHSMALTKGEGESYGGAVIRTTGPAYDTGAFDPDAVTRTEVGTAALEFSDGDNGVFALALNDGAQPTKNITRLRFSESRTVCR
jgi:hypothetical protein